MEVILTANIKKLGKVGDIVKVKTGFARNYLFVNNKAIRKNKENLKKVEAKRKEIEEKEIEIKKNAENIIEKSKNVILEFNKESDDNGQLYGSINSKELLKALKEKSIEIDADSLILRKQIKSVGDHEVEINPYLDLSTTIKIIVKSTKNS